MLWVLCGIFAALYLIMFVSVRKLIGFLNLQKDCDDTTNMVNCDGKSKSLIGIFIAIGVGLIFLNWGIIWFGHINYAY